MRPPANRIATISGSTDHQEGAQLARGAVDAAPRGSMKPKWLEWIIARIVPNSRPSL
ncbi:hypothetical protein PtrSN002B_004391 [Pyrenophora tritici-repentis]|uniref:Uncharacterized protein n=1 Tax=Pyrenophora tritici-repentis TaxID=45151 RepID=A0A2W1E7T4_9PLEO|nr:hypothetical protein PtrV1_06925 [Pyrenophora tritici-repentis]KAF7447973.1 hypothetical protein A1F99_073370 [Pyrenophora tritici-repentis]KAF7571677.1 hypothetical protein PtrM4_091770 [Pyrenophora tritici-repentis]KAG9385105.1 hypothetical protein A1F94_004652 [Pyrenophora tritici-repentis]KAI0574459.1 hypothetical protein Alg130_09678 [Pyrenophora tritici-repentis]